MKRLLSKYMTFSLKKNEVVFIKDRKYKLGEFIE
jgi:hypothetical protein